MRYKIYTYYNNYLGEIVLKEGEMSIISRKINGENMLEKIIEDIKKGGIYQRKSMEENGKIIEMVNDDIPQDIYIKLLIEKIIKMQYIVEEED